MDNGQISEPSASRSLRHVPHASTAAGVQHGLGLFTNVEHRVVDLVEFHALAEEKDPDRIALLQTVVGQSQRVEDGFRLGFTDDDTQFDRACDVREL